MAASVGDPAITAMIRHHHERLDGAGYPDGLAGEAIPLGARIIAVADTFDAMTSNRAYRRASSHKRALDVLRAEAGKQLDADAVAAFVGYYRGRRTVAWSAFAAAAPQRLFAWLGGVSPGVRGRGGRGRSRHRRREPAGSRRQPRRGGASARGQASRSSDRDPGLCPARAERRPGRERAALHAQVLRHALSPAACDAAEARRAGGPAAHDHQAPQGQARQRPPRRRAGRRGPPRRRRRHRRSPGAQPVKVKPQAEARKPAKPAKPAPAKPAPVKPAKPKPQAKPDKVKPAPAPAPAPKQPKVKPPKVTLPGPLPQPAPPAPKVKKPKA